VTWKPTVLVVARTPSVVASVAEWVTEAGVRPLIVDSYPAARQHLERGYPAAVVSEVRLGEYNGLQLTLHARDRGIPVILIGAPDPILQREAEVLGATYLGEKLEPQRLLTLLASATAEAMAMAAVLRRRYMRPSA
jgi:DNA-binding NtrC family response regulator